MFSLENLTSIGTARNIGILGGSFNPAHAGHLHIAKEAIKKLGLDAVMLMVSPQNPLKSTKDMASFDTRFNSAENIARHNPKIFPVDIETKLNTCYTAETLSFIVKNYPKTNFVWIMGMDNLLQIHKWENWQYIFETIPIAVIDRPPAVNSVRNCPAIMSFSKYRIREKDARNLKYMPAPAWVILHVPLHPLSATEIRNKEQI